MKSKTLLFVSTVLTLTAGLTGCISSHTTTYKDVERVPVSFASEKAGRIFYESLTRVPAAHAREESRSSVNLIVIDLERKTIAGPNRLFNEAVAACDTDKDGTITEQEAQVFASSPFVTKGR